MQPTSSFSEKYLNDFATIRMRRISLLPVISPFVATGQMFAVRQDMGITH